MIETKIYLYDSAKNDYKGEDLSKYLVLGDNLVDTLDEELDTFTITLEGYPTRDEFAPSTKMILEKWDTENGESILSRSCHMVVNSDVVTQPVMSNNGFFTHNIDLFEASAVAQGRVVDNIAVTYKLKDVTLDETVAYPSDLLADFVLKDENGDSPILNRNNFIQFTSSASDNYIVGDMVSLYTNNKYVWDISEADLNRWQELTKYHLYSKDTPYVLNLPLPKLFLELPKYNLGTTTDYERIGEVTYDVNLIDTDLITGDVINSVVKTVKPSSVWNATKVYTPILATVELPDFTIIDHLGEIDTSVNDTKPYWYVKKLGVKSSITEDYNLSFTTKPDHSYQIILSLHNYKTGDTIQNPFSRRILYSKEMPISQCYRHAQRTFFFDWRMNPNEIKYITDQSLTLGVYFVTYSSGDKKKIWASAPPANAYDLFLKCQYASSTYMQYDENAWDELPFYMESDDIALLQKTTIIENFYYQKNFWQMLLEIGKYIHSIPKIKFGKDDRYLVTWRKLGINRQEGEVKKDLGVMSIFNNRSLENYISSCSSYVNNAVQIGGVIEENIVAKTSSDTYLVSNNTANLEVSKPMIEIVDMTATIVDNQYSPVSSGVTVNLAGNKMMNVFNTRLQESDWTEKVVEGVTKYATTIVLNKVYPYIEEFNIRILDENGNEVPTDTYTTTNNTGLIEVLSNVKYVGTFVLDIFTQFTNGFIFAKEIYSLLDNEEPSLANPLRINKGRAIYYSQGSTKIEGLTYRLPVMSSGTQKDQYAIKRILGLAFNVEPVKWSKIKVNDFYFTIKYRTKDNLRNEQSRPDLRHYLLNSKYDKYPHHKQFNNQEDTLVDARKMGNNVYGKLIKTGNTEYMVVEYRLKDSNTKTAGELWKLEGNLYYVTKVKNTYYGNYVISEVTFSKDFNKLSAVIGIPSEPRFYEISEQSKIDRDVVFNQYVCLGTKYQFHNASSLVTYQHYKANWKWLKFLLLGNNNYWQQPKCAITHFTAISEGDKFSKFMFSPICVYTFHNTLSLEWDMLDNFSAGDKSKEIASGTSAIIDDAYRSLVPARYKNLYGRVDYCNFFICDDEWLLNTNNTANNYKAISNLPEIAESDVDTATQFPLVRVETPIVVKLDNREVFKGNYNLQMLTDSDRFVLSSYLWNLSKKNIKVALLYNEVNKIAGETIPRDNIVSTYAIGDNIEVLNDYTALGTGEDYGLSINMSTILKNVDLTNVKAIAIIDTKKVVNDVYNEYSYFVCARNISGLSDEDKRKDWYITYADQSFFKKQ